MYDFISGSLAHSDMTTAVIDCSGVGYKLFISMNTYKKISGQEKITLKTYLNVKEDALDLYGFYDEQERLFFTFLISVNGVGSKVAMAVLSDLTPEEFAAVSYTHLDVYKRQVLRGIFHLLIELLASV